jgi:GTP cyclohydrolase I
MDAASKTAELDVREGRRMKKKYDVHEQVKINGLFEFQRDVVIAFSSILQSLERWTGKVKRHGPNFEDTPERVARAYVEIFHGLFDNGDQINDILRKTFPAKSDEMITVGPVEVWSMCPHHLLPVQLWVWVSYIPKKKVLGLSKLARIADLLAKKPALQEDTTAEIADTIQRGLHPLGVGVLIKGRHLCMEMRGVKKKAMTTTTAIEGVFRKNPEAKSEFLAAVRGDR